MAIQMRRGAYADFDPGQLVPGELAVVTSGDPSGNGGRAVYACVGAGSVKRLVTSEEVQAGDAANPSNARALRNAMGLGDSSGPLAVESGGTGQSGATPFVLTGSLSPKAGFSVGSATARVWGEMCQLHVSATLASAVTAGSSYQIGTIPEGYRPAMASVGACSGAPGFVQAAPNGALTYVPAFSKPTGSALVASVMYMLA